MIFADSLSLIHSQQTRRRTRWSTQQGALGDLGPQLFKSGGIFEKVNEFHDLLFAVMGAQKEHEKGKKTRGAL